MFEKEAEEYLKKDGTKAEQIFNMLNEISPLKITSKQAPFILAVIQQAFQDGAEFGYNKALEEVKHDLMMKLKDEGIVKPLKDSIFRNERLSSQEQQELCAWIECAMGFGENLDECAKELTEAKDIIKELVKGVRITFDHRGFITNVDAFVSKAEQFLKEVEI